MTHQNKNAALLEALLVLSFAKRPILERRLFSSVAPFNTAEHQRAADGAEVGNWFTACRLAQISSHRRLLVLNAATKPHANPFYVHAECLFSCRWGVRKRGLPRVSSVRGRLHIDSFIFLYVLIHPSGMWPECCLFPTPSMTEMPTQQLPGTSSDP